MEKFCWSDKNLKTSSSMTGINLKKLSSLGIIFLLLTSTFLIFIPKIESQNRFSGSGKGTPEDPYVITNVKQLQEMKYDLSAHYVLGNDIDASETINWNNGEGFEPIGNWTHQFTGSFDGKGHKIYNLYINRTTDHVGLFGVVGKEGIIKNVRLENVRISRVAINLGSVGGLIGWNYGSVFNTSSTGNVYGRERESVGGLIGINVGSVYNSYSDGNVYGYSNVGGLIGVNDGLVSNCYSIAAVNGTSYVGGLVGRNYKDVSNSYSTGIVSGIEFVGGLIGENHHGTVSNSYSTGSVKGNKYVGGLIGSNSGDVSNSYSRGSVNGQEQVGGLIGFNRWKVSNSYSTGSVKGNKDVGGLIGVSNIPASNSFWDIETSGLRTSAGGIGKTTAEMKNVRTYTDVGWSEGLESPWDFVGNPYDDEGDEDVWDINPNINDGYPYLTTILFKKKPMQFIGSGKGTPEDPYVITNVKQLQEMKYNLNAHYVLGNDIDASETINWNYGKGFVPIGDHLNPFNGSFDGRGYKIYNLYINTTSRVYVGLFGAVGSGGIIKNVRLENVRITGTKFIGIGGVGALIGLNSGKVYNSSVTGIVSGIEVVGGLIGENKYFGTVSNSYSIAIVKGEHYVGGLIGRNDRGIVSNCYSTGTVSAKGGVGGLIGWNRDEGVVSNSYSTATVNGGGPAGGLIGVNEWRAKVFNSYATGDVSGDESVGGLIGLNELGAEVSRCYSTGTVIGQRFVGGLIGWNYGGKVSNCYSRGNVIGQAKEGGGDRGGRVSPEGRVGGLIGWNYGEVYNSYSTGFVKGNKDVGGLVGVNYGTVSNSFWDIETSGLKTSDGGTGKTTAEMKNVRTYTDLKWSKGLESPWDFVGNPYDDKGNEDIWDINPNINDGYPYLTAIPTPAPAPSPACIIESISVSNIGTVIINGVTYPVFDVVIKASKGCGDNIKVIKVIPGKDPMNEQPALSCSLISKTSRNDISERTYRCTAKWNYLTSPDQISFAIKNILASIIASPGLTISEKINFVVSILSASTLEKPVILYNATFSLQLDSSNTVDLTVQAPKSKINAIDRYLYVKTLSTYILYITPVITGTCLVDIITDKTCIVVSAAMLSIGTLSYFALQKQAYDPYNEDYTSIFEAPPPSDKIKELANVYGDIIYDLFYYVNYINASMISLSRAFTAYEKGDYQWYNKQLSKALEYTEKSLMHFDKIKAFLNNELAKIEPHINKEMFESGLNYIEKNGLQKEVAEILKELGISKHVNVTEVVDIAKKLGYSEIKPREIIEAMVSTGEEIKNYVKILEKEILTTTPTQTSPTPLMAMPLNIELIIILIAIVAILASLVIIIRKYKTK